MNNFWQKLPKPFTVLAPMDGVTDIVFREVINEFGRPDVFFTEFTMTDGLVSVGHNKVAERLLFTQEQKPIVAQIWGTVPHHFYQVAKELKKLGFSGIDINMGCPERTVIRFGACSGLIKNPALAAEIIQATKEGAEGLPVSVKTRIGFEKEAIHEWLSFLLQQDVTVLTVHLRTVRELSKVPAHWELMQEIIKLRNDIAPHTLITGNGDISSMNDIKTKYEKYRCDGFMIGRGIFANPWMFSKIIDEETVTPKQRVDYFLHHIALFEKQWQDTKNFAILKKFAKTYINNFPEAAIFREKLMETKKIEDLKQTLKNYNSK
jgi:tRNA-dihydrouridine synthase